MIRYRLPFVQALKTGTFALKGVPKGYYRRCRRVLSQCMPQNYLNRHGHVNKAQLTREKPVQVANRHRTTSPKRRDFLGYPECVIDFHR
jgi:hypothetical protein